MSENCSQYFCGCEYYLGDTEEISPKVYICIAVMLVILTACVRIGSEWFIFKDYYPMKERSPVLCIVMIAAIAVQLLMYPLGYTYNYFTRNWGDFKYTYRTLFYAESPATPFPDDAAEYTAFAADLATPLALDLAAGPLAADSALWTHPTDYAACQALADAARGLGVGILRYRSVRDPGGGANLAVLTCRAFAAPQPKDRQTWRIRIGPAGVQALREHPRLGLEFPPDSFATDPRLAGMAWARPRAR